ncbi:MAG: HD domain-containing protein [Pseudomonadota bacterium]
MDRIGQQLAFLAEIDRLKTVLRGTPIHDGTRRENSAEHSWHVCLYALTLAEHAEVPVNVPRVIKMLLLHDIVEIDAGDQPIHSDHDPDALARAERVAADRLFGLLPPDQADEYRALWDEFEACASADAVFAKSVDRIQPVAANLASDGGTWRDYAVSYEQLEIRVGVSARRGAAKIWARLEPRIRDWFRV